MNLFDEIEKAKTDKQVVAAIRQFFAELPELENKTTFESRADMFAIAAKSSTKFRAELIAEAVEDPAIREGLRRYTLSKSEDGKAVEPELVALLLSEPSKRKRGRQAGSGSTYTASRVMRYARAVWCVYHAGAGRYTLSANDTRPNNAFSIVAKATGATFDEVRNSIKDGQLERLTRIEELFRTKGN